MNWNICFIPHQDPHPQRYQIIIILWSRCSNAQQPYNSVNDRRQVQQPGRSIKQRPWSLLPMVHGLQTTTQNRASTGRIRPDCPNPMFVSPTSGLNCHRAHDMPAHHFERHFLADPYALLFYMSENLSRTLGVFGGEASVPTLLVDWLQCQGGQCDGCGKSGTWCGCGRVKVYAGETVQDSSGTLQVTLICMQLQFSNSIFMKTIRLVIIPSFFVH